MLPNEHHRRHSSWIRHLVTSELAPLAAEIESSGRFSLEAYELFAREKLFHLALPQSHGGMDADATTLAMTIEAIAAKSPSAALIVFPTNAVLRILSLAADAEQKERFFSESARHNRLMAFCLTEPDFGSAAFDLTASALRQGDHYLVNGVKSFITLGDRAHYYLTFVRTGPEPKSGGISVLMIPRESSGLTFSAPSKKMGLHGSLTSQMYMLDVRVPVANRLLAEGHGWRVLTEFANPMRAWGAAALAVGVAQGLLDESLEHLRTSAPPQKPDQATAFTLADMRMKIEAARSLLYRVCAMLDEAVEHTTELETFTSMAKCLASDTAMDVANLASQVVGPAMAEENHPVSRLFCAAKAIQIFDGSNQVQRMIVARNLAFS